MPNRTCVLRVIAIAVPALLALSTPRLRADTPRAGGAIDKYDVTRHDLKIRRFADLLGLMEDALRVNAMDRYVGLQKQLMLMMQGEIETAAAEARARRDEKRVADKVLEAEMGAWVGTAMDGATGGENRESADRGARLARRRVSEMKKIHKQIEKLRPGLREGPPGACARNAALADRFLGLMRAARAAARPTRR